MQPQDDLLRFDSFPDLVAHRGIKTRSSKSGIEAIEMVDLLETICHLGDKTLALARGDSIPASRAEELLLDLMSCFADPIKHARRIIEIRKVLREHGV